MKYIVFIIVKFQEDVKGLCRKNKDLSTDFSGMHVKIILLGRVESLLGYCGVTSLSLHSVRRVTAFATINS
ncbi:hypothetical protein FIU87_15175 [Bacillus sp. THAF10]|nr:hypothetical protein FIU87_15175 [Bacillus sp. THAF10]